MTPEQHKYLEQYVDSCGGRITRITFEPTGSMILETEHPSMNHDWAYTYKDRVYLDGSLEELDVNEVAV